MLKALTKEHIAKFAAIENNMLQLSNLSVKIEPTDIIKYCSRKNRGLFIYTYDLEYFNYLVENKIDGITVKTVYTNTDIMSINIINKRNKITLVNAAFFFPKRPENLFNALFYIYNKIGKGILPSYTAATFALRLWRFRFQKETLRGISSLNKDFIEKAYAGGRSEIISKTLKKGYYYDINSMYGAMMTKDMPVGRIISTFTRNSNLIGFYECEVDQQDLNLPPLWKKLHNNNKSKDMLCFPADKFTGVFSGDEIDMAIEAGAKVKILHGIEWESKAPIFKEFIEYLYKLKTETKLEWFEAFLKKAMVSLYGKFAENKNNYQEIIQCKDVQDYYKIIDENIDNDLKIVSECNRTVAIKRKKNKYNKNNYNLPHLSAYITSLGRIEIYNIAKNAETVAYIETDAVFSNKKLKIGNKLGDLKLVGKIINAEFYQSKTYRYTIEQKEHFVAAGISCDADKEAYFKGEKVKIYKKQKFIKEQKEYSIKMKNAQFIKRDIHDNYSNPLSINEIFQKMQKNNQLIA